MHENRGILTLSRRKRRKASSLSSWLLSGKYTLLALYSRKYLIIPSLSQMNAHNEPNVQRIICRYCFGKNTTL